MNALPAGGASGSTSAGVAHRSGWAARLYRPPMIPLPELLEEIRARALPGREAAAQNELMPAFQQCPRFWESIPGATLHQVIFTFRARSSSKLIARTRSISSWRSSSVRP
jgi:hypothetical protein